MNSQGPNIISPDFHWREWGQHIYEITKTIIKTTKIPVHPHF